MQNAWTPEAIDAAIARRFVAEGCMSRADLLLRAPDTIAAMVERLNREYVDRGLRPLRYFPVDFLDPTHKGVYALPFPPDAAWVTLHTYGGLFAYGSGATLIAPLYWQTEPLLWEALHPQGIPSGVMHNGNVPVACEMIRQTRFALLVVDAEVASQTLAYLAERNLTETIAGTIAFSPLYGQYKPIDGMGAGPILREFHVTPGCPLFFQGPDEAGTDRFRAHDDFLVEIDGDSCLVTGLSFAVIPLLRYRISMRVRIGADGFYRIDV